MISIHALQAESDQNSYTLSVIGNNFNPRPPSGERHVTNSTHCVYQDFNPRPPSGERLCNWCGIDYYKDISIHALQAESDFPLLYLYYNTFVFQSTPSKRRATIYCGCENKNIFISIHALQAESDQQIFETFQDLSQFQSTPSKRRATFSVQTLA